MSFLPEPEQFNGPDTRPMDSVESPYDEARREHDWWVLESEARDFAARYGAAAMLRCVSRALETR